jgi:hypothetical protein
MTEVLQLYGDSIWTADEVNTYLEEKVINSDSYNEALSRIGGTDGRLVRVWWDANPNAPHEHPGEVEWMPHPWVEDK